MVGVNHLLANISGIIIARYFFKVLRLKSNNFFVVLILFLIPIQSLILFCIDIFAFKNPMSLAIGFSGILYGIDSFILMTTIFGKKSFIGIQCNFHRNFKLLRSISVLTFVGIIWSFLPGISLMGHLSGLLSGILLFFF